MSTNEFRVLLLFSIFNCLLLIFLYAFFPLQRPVNTKDVTSDVFPQPVIDKLVFVVIDALRYDFISLMPFVDESVAKHESCLVTTKAEAPTVTMPRIKALTSGAVPNFIDIILNFNASDFGEENILLKARKQGHKIVFCGDDTWLKLFPQAFTRSTGVTSFFVTDYIQVDTNVTNCMDSELNNTDWSFFILHYLGLDHIGHMEGPFSSLVKPKLVEMDGVVKKLWHHLKKLEDAGKDVMLIVTGDHGMKDSGGHGGVSYGEVTVPLVSVGRPCLQLPGWPSNSDHEPPQTDVAPTLSALLGVAIPAGNMGKIIPSLLPLNHRNIVLILHNNRKILQQTSGIEVEGSSETDTLVEEWLTSGNDTLQEVLTSRLFKETDHLCKRIIKSASEFNVPWMVASCIALWLLLAATLVQVVKDVLRRHTMVQLFISGAIVLHSLSLLSTSFIEEEHQTWYFLWASLCLLICLEAASRKDSNKWNSIIVHLFLAMVFHRVARKLNQTGDKWASLPDFQDFLSSQPGQPALITIYLTSLVLLLAWVMYEGCSQYQTITYGISILCSLSFRLSTGYIHTDLYPTSSGTTEVQIFWVFFTIFVIQSITYKTPAYLVWTLLAALLLRPHNVVLIPLQIFISKVVGKYFSDHPSWCSAMHIFLGHTFYFYQGNSNSIANIDVMAGYIGVDEYKPAYAATLIFVHTYAAHILAFLLSPKSPLVFSLCRMLPVTVFSTLILSQQHHLFIWSVFAPKLLFEASHTVLQLCLLLSNFLWENCAR